MLLQICVFTAHQQGLCCHSDHDHVARPGTGYWLQGFCNGNDCQAFPIVIGEFGGYMKDCRSRCAKANPNCMALELNVSH